MRAFLTVLFVDLRDRASVVLDLHRYSPCHTRQGSHFASFHGLKPITGASDSWRLPFHTAQAQPSSTFHKASTNATLPPGASKSISSSSACSCTRSTSSTIQAKREGDDRVRIGVTQYAVEQLGDVTLVELPEVGTDVQAHERFGDIESVKTVSELFAPVSGEVVEVNGELEGSPELVNENPYSEGWMVVIKVADFTELDRLMESAAYEDFVSKIE